SGSTLRDQTYIYSRSVGGSSDLVVIAVHLRSALCTGDDGFAEVDGIWQISDEPDAVEEGDEYGKMTVTEVDPGEMTISMANGEEILLNPDDEIHLFGDIWIRTADQDANDSVNLRSGLPEDPLRFYIFAGGREPS
ncbi:MAG TPA: S-layer protein domain-containing protein, partial [Methanothrix sp.]|nr:S-layer protein domain-containing protein [Methanothrix sp.]